MSEEITERMRNPLSMFDVSGQTAVVTGASGAFGRGISITLGALGANLMLASGNEEALETVAKEVVEVGGKAATIVRRPETLEDAEAIRDGALENFGAVKMLAIGSG
ncbi:MAG: SDR family NAD(P)-dependent oxidoreductase, partial [Alphaproteobacteria bacterium]